MTTATTNRARSPISWVASLYFVQGMQFFVVMLIAGLPSTAVWALGLLVGINMVFGGMALTAMALHARKETL